MSRDGPATRRVQLLTDSQDCYHLRTAFVELFEADDGGLASNKERIFLAKIHIEATVLPNMSGYCEPLEQLVEESYDILTAAHKSRDYQGLYDQIIDAFDAAEMTLIELPDFVPWSRRSRSEGARIVGGRGSLGHALTSNQKHYGDRRNATCSGLFVA
jgi:hypothetical protein